MSVLLSALALTALRLLAEAVSVLAAHGALVADTRVTLDPVEPPRLPRAGFHRMDSIVAGCTARRYGDLRLRTVEIG